MAFIYSDADLNENQQKLLNKRIHGKTVEFEVKDSDLNKDGKFVDVQTWESDLWDTIAAKIELTVGRFPKPSRIQSNIKKPGSSHNPSESDDSYDDGRNVLEYLTDLLY